MTLNYAIKDLFTVPDDYYLAHCISADFAMGKGIAVEFNNRYNMREKLIKSYPNYNTNFMINNYKGDCLLEDKVFNLVTKQAYYNKPTYKSLRLALLRMKSLCNSFKIKKVAMPKIGCGLDRLDWCKVENIIHEIFDDMDIEILICIKQ